MNLSIKHNLRILSSHNETVLSFSKLLKLPTKAVLAF